MTQEVVIAGAGMGGLSAAIALGLMGQQSLLCERRGTFTELGAGIQLGPNATRILSSWGMLHEVQALAAQPQSIAVFQAQDPHPLAKLDLGASFERRYAAPYLTIHRADFQACLLERLSAIGQTDLRMGATFLNAQANQDGLQLQWSLAEPLESPHEQTVPKVTSQAPSTWSLNAQALIGADGVSSQVRRLFWPRQHIQATRHLAYRTAIPQKLLPSRLRQTQVRVYLGPQMHWVHYPIRSGEWLNIVVLIEAPNLSALKAHAPVQPLYQTWQEEISLQESSEHFKRALNGAHADLHDLFRAVDQWSAWRLFDADPLLGADQMARERVALLGDAAHPMLPFLAQGAGMSIEDAQALARAWSENAQSVQSRLGAYAQFRWQRNARVQSRARANAKTFHSSGLMANARNWALSIFGERLLDMPWLYGHRA